MYDIEHHIFVSNINMTLSHLIKQYKSLRHIFKIHYDIIDIDASMLYFISIDIYISVLHGVYVN
jgi:hypothetical protein